MPIAASKVQMKSKSDCFWSHACDKTMVLFTRNKTGISCRKDRRADIWEWSRFTYPASLDYAFSRK